MDKSFSQLGRASLLRSLSIFVLSVVAGYVACQTVGITKAEFCKRDIHRMCTMLADSEIVTCMKEGLNQCRPQ